MIVDLYSLPPDVPARRLPDELFTLRASLPYYCYGMAEYRLIVKCKLCSAPVTVYNWHMGPVLCAAKHYRDEAGLIAVAGEQVSIDPPAYEPLPSPAAESTFLEPMPPGEPVQARLQILERDSLFRATLSTVATGKGKRIFTHECHLWVDVTGVTFGHMIELGEALRVWGEQIHGAMTKGTVCPRLRAVDDFILAGGKAILLELDPAAYKLLETVTEGKDFKATYGLTQWARTYAAKFAALHHTKTPLTQAVIDALPDAIYYALMNQVMRLAAGAEKASRPSGRLATGF